jgi:alanine dehydrogenase
VSASASLTIGWHLWSVGCGSRAQLVAECDVILLPKPIADDLNALRAGQVLWGWPHCVQDAAVTQLAVDRRLTLIAWEAMNHWGMDGRIPGARLPQEQ